MKFRPLSFDYHAEATTRLLELQQGQPKRTLWIIPSNAEGSNDEDVENTDSKSEHEGRSELFGSPTPTGGPTNTETATVDKNGTTKPLTPSPSSLPTATASAPSLGPIAEDRCNHHDMFAASFQTPFAKASVDEITSTCVSGDTRHCSIFSGDRNRCEAETEGLGTMPRNKINTMEDMDSGYDEEKEDGEPTATMLVEGHRDNDGTCTEEVGDEEAIEEVFVCRLKSPEPAPSRAFSSDGPMEMQGSPQAKWYSTAESASTTNVTSTNYFLDFSKCTPELLQLLGSIRRIKNRPRIANEPCYSSLVSSRKGSRSVPRVVFQSWSQTLRSASSQIFCVSNNPILSHLVNSNANKPAAFVASKCVKENELALTGHFGNFQVGTRESREAIRKREETAMVVYTGERAQPLDLSVSSNEATGLQVTMILAAICALQQQYQGSNQDQPSQASSFCKTSATGSSVHSSSNEASNQLKRKRDCFEMEECSRQRNIVARKDQTDDPDDGATESITPQALDQPVDKDNDNNCSCFSPELFETITTRSGTNASGPMMVGTTGDINPSTPLEVLTTDMLPTQGLYNRKRPSASEVPVPKTEIAPAEENATTFASFSRMARRPKAVPLENDSVITTSYSPHRENPRYDGNITLVDSRAATRSRSDVPVEGQGRPILVIHQHHVAPPASSFTNPERERFMQKSAETNLPASQGRAATTEANPAPTPEVQASCICRPDQGTQGHMESSYEGVLPSPSFESCAGDVGWVHEDGESVQAHSRSKTPPPGHEEAQGQSNLWKDEASRKLDKKRKRLEKKQRKKERRERRREKRRRSSEQPQPNESFDNDAACLGSRPCSEPRADDILEAGVVSMATQKKCGTMELELDQKPRATNSNTATAFKPKSQDKQCDTVSAFFSASAPAISTARTETGNISRQEDRRKYAICNYPNIANDACPARSQMRQVQPRVDKTAANKTDLVSSYLVREEATAATVRHTNHRRLADLTKEEQNNALDARTGSLANGSETARGYLGSPEGVALPAYRKAHAQLEPGSLKPLHLPCSEKFIESWSETIAELAAGKWTRTVFNHTSSATRLNHGLGAGRRILFTDSPLVDVCGVDMEIANRQAAIVQSVKKWQTAGEYNALARFLAQLSAKERYTRVLVILVADVNLNHSLLSQIMFLQNALHQSNRGNPPTNVVFSVVRPPSLSATVAEFAFSSFASADSRIYDNICARLSDENYKARAKFLLRLVPTFTVFSAIQALEFFAPRTHDASNCATIGLQRLLGGEDDRAKIVCAVRSRMPTAAEINVKSIRQLSIVLGATLSMLDQPAQQNSNA